MAEKVLDQIIVDLRKIFGTRYPHRGELGSLRLMGHTPKRDYIAYDLCADFKDGNERLVAKIYRPSRCRGTATTSAQIETANLKYVHRKMPNKKLSGVPRLFGNFSERCAVVTDKIYGLPLQPMIVKAALLPECADSGSLVLAASRIGKWLRDFHNATAAISEPFDADGLMANLVMLCEKCRVRGLDPTAVKIILETAHDVLSHSRKVFPSSAVLTNFTPLNVIITEEGVGFSDFSKMKRLGNSFEDAAMFIAASESLEKYPFCSRRLVGQIQGNFLNAYGMTASTTSMVHLLKVKIMLEMLVQGRTGETNAVKNVMWSNVMRGFIHQSVRRSFASA
jgi:hypothetical protein